MAQEIVNETQNLSYTNQDFSSIYTEVLSLIKQLTYKWDPSISDESDPGVILVKLSAIIADKCNYNIDKSILEAFPLSVTQDSNARQLYEQLGYYMDWYESARTNVSIAYTGKATDPIQTYTIPKFTIICDSESMHNYALVGTEDSDGIVVSDSFLSNDGNPILVTAIEGTPVRFTYQGESIITPHMVDSVTRRLYFSSAYVSQNGIFINNVGQDNYGSWKRVNNLYEQTYNELRYTFGYDSKSNLCYIEFPDNYSELFGSGIEITYMIIDETYENIPSQQLTQFLSPVRVEINDSETIELDAFNTKIANYTASYGHKNKETINEAYLNYRRTVGTFKTLITLRDYLNFIRDREAEICSNAFVCDRTNDVQSVYKIMSRKNDLDSLIVKVEQTVDRTTEESTFDYRFIKTQDEEVDSSKMYYKISDNNDLEKIKDPTGNPREQGWYELDGVEPKVVDALSPFSLKFYLLKNAVSLSSKSAYDETFEMLYQPPDIDTLLEDTAHLEHTYEDILPLGENTYKKTKDTSFSHTKSYYYYEKDTKKYRLITDLDSYETYYTPVDLEEYEIGDIIDPSSKDWFEEISGVTEKTTDTFARLGEFDGDRAFFVQANITAISRPAEYGWFEYIVGTGEYILSEDERPVIGKMYYVLKNYLESHLGIPGEQYDLYELDIEALLPHIVFFKNIYPIKLDISTYEPVNSDVQVIIMNNIITALFENTNSSEIEFGEDVSLEYLINIVENSDDRIRTARFNTLEYTTKALYYDKESGVFKSVELDNDMTNLNPTDYQSQETILRAMFKKDILAKSILAGTTQLIVPDSTFTYHLSHKFISFLDGISNITSEAIINFQGDEAATSYSLDDEEDLFIRKTYTLKANETITLYRPSLTDEQQFLSGTRFEYLIFNDIEENQSYKLSQGEYIIFYTQVVNDSSAVVGYNVYGFAEGAIIKPEFELYAQNSSSILTKYARNRIIPHFETYRGLREYDTFTNNSTYMTEIRNSANLADNTISNSDAIAIQKLNTVELTSEDKFKFFWVLSNPTYSNDDNLKTFTLFDEYDSHEDHPIDLNTYTLKSGEYLYYTDADEKDLFILGPGTIITRNCGVIPETVTYDEIHTSIYFMNCDLLNIDSTRRCKYITNAAGHISPILNGMYVVEGTPNEYTDREGSPVSLGLYEYNGVFYILSEDEEFLDGRTYYDKSIFTRSTDTDIVPDVVYYLMLSHKNPDWYKRVVQDIDSDGNPIYSYFSDPMSAPVFEEVVSDGSNELINPKELGYYEKVVYNNQVIEDVYMYNDSEVPSNHARFASTLDETVLSRNILKSISMYENWDITNPNSYRTLSEDEVIDIPTTNALNLKIPTYKQYFKKVGSNYEEITNIDYLSKPKTEGWYEYDAFGDKYDLTNDEEPEIIAVSDSNISSILEYVEAEYGMDFYKKCYFFSPNLFSQTYYYDIDRKKVEFLASDVIYGSNGNLGSPLDRLLYLYQQMTTEYSGGTEWLDEISYDRWSSLYTYNPPNTWAVPSMTDTPVGQWTTAPSAAEVENRYIKVLGTKLIDRSDVMDAIYPAFTYDIKPDDTEFLDADFFVPAKHFDTLEIVPSPESPLSYYELSGKYNLLDSDLKLGRMFPKEYDLTLDKFQVVYLPYLYKVSDLVSYSTSKYYTAKDYFTKTFRDSIDSWTCSAVDNNKIAEDPINYIHSLWRNMQYNTSLTITESEIWSFAEGDAVIVEAEEVTDTILDWPIFSGNEVTIDTNHFKLAYQRKGQDFTTLDNLSIDGYSWRGYSSLLLNTSSNNGQRLYPNHYITLYGEESMDPLLEFSGEPNSDVTFQLKYPVANKSGKFIEVKTTDTLGESILNSIYIFKTFFNGEFYQYTTDVYDTYLYFNSYLPDPESGEPMVRSPREIEIPVGVPWGDYLLPISSKNEIILEAHFRQGIEVGKEEIDINLKPYSYEESESQLKIIGLSQDLKLHSFVDKERTEFIGDKLQFVELNLDRYCKVNLPAYLTQSLEMSPVDLGLYEMDSYGEYFVSENEGIGVELIKKISEIDIVSTQNPYKLGWYEFDGTNYILSTDTSPVREKDYYVDMDFYIPINKVNSYINFTIKSEDGSEYDKAVTFIIKDVFRFSKNSELGKDSYEKIFAHMRRLDDNEDYNFTFVPNQNDLIRNPLSPTSFWNHNHVYNPYTIAQLDFDDIDYKFTNAK